jgi:hypothetical protein
MTVETKQFPIAPVTRIVVVVMVFVMDGEFPQPLAFELSAAARTYWRIHFQRLLAVTLHPNLSFASSLGYEIMLPILVWPIFV